MVNTRNNVIFSFTASIFNRARKMNDIFQKAVAHNEASRKPSTPWEADKPHHQPFFLFNKTKQTWEAQQAGGDGGNNGSQPLSRLAVYAWNIDFMLPYAQSRMEAGLATLHELTALQPPSTAVVIFLQECLEPDLATIAGTPWVRDRFALTDLGNGNWASSHYGTTTLVDRRLMPAAALFRVHYEKTRMERDALFVDVLLGGRDGANKKKVRLCNSHLESLDRMPPYRPPQVELIARFLKEDGLHAGIAGGDFNAIQDFDRSLHSDNGLKDAYLELGGKEDSEEGYTWGQQAATFLREKFGCSRMDKIFFRGGLQLKGFERFGADVQLDNPRERDNIVELGFDKPWITDHYGIKVEFELDKGSEE